MASEITVAVNGALGKMGSTVLTAAALEPGVIPIGGADIAASSCSTVVSGTSISVPLAPSLSDLFKIVKPDVVVDFTNGEAAKSAIITCIDAGVRVVSGSTGLAPDDFEEILKMVWWRLDRALDLESIKWSAMLGALEALERGCTAIVDHHESPEAIEGSLSVIAEACETVGIRVLCSYGVTDRHGPDGAKKGLEENRRFLEEGGRGMVGLHASFTCEDETIESVVEIAESFGVGVHVHVAEGAVDANAVSRLKNYSRDNWLIIHGVHLEDSHDLKGILVHNPRSNMNNSVGCQSCSI